MKKRLASSGCFGSCFVRESRSQKGIAVCGYYLLSSWLACTSNFWELECKEKCLNVMLTLIFYGDYLARYFEHSRDLKNSFSQKNVFIIKHIKLNWNNKDELKIDHTRRYVIFT